MKSSCLSTTALVLSALCAGPLARASGFDQFVGIGDSTLDSGYFRYHSLGIPAYDAALIRAVAAGAKGGFAGPGEMDSTLLAARFGLSAAPLGNGGTNYANGGAYTAAFANTNVPTIQQIRDYLKAVQGSANPHALYVVSTGNNDLLFVQQQSEAWIAANPSYLGGLATSLAGEVATLQQAGARTLLVPNNYNSAVFAGPGGTIASDKTELYARSSAFTTAMWSRLTAVGVNFIPADLDSVFRYVVTHPTAFGFTASSVLAASAPSPTSALFTTTAMLPESTQQSYLFIDGKHVTQAGQQIESDYFYSLLAAPSQVGLVLEAAVQSGLARADTIQGQLEFAQAPRTSRGLNTWLSVGAGNLDLHNSTGLLSSSASPFACTVGADFLTQAGFVAGAALTAGTQRQAFTDGGQARAPAQALSLYVGKRHGPWWGNGMVGLGLFQPHLTRPVRLGVFTDENNGHAHGRDQIIALRGGRDFVARTLVTGPVIGFLYQQSRLNAFSESGRSGVTALSFGEQTRQSIIGQLGWRGLVRLGAWQVLVSTEWNHDWARPDRQISTALRSVVTAPYQSDVAPFAADWGKAALGVSYQISTRAALHGTARSVFGNPQLRSLGGELSLNLAF